MAVHETDVNDLLITREQYMNLFAGGHMMGVLNNGKIEKYVPQG